MFGIVMLVLFICMVIAMLGYLSFANYDRDDEEGRR